MLSPPGPAGGPEGSHTPRCAARLSPRALPQTSLHLEGGLFCSKKILTLGLWV